MRTNIVASCCMFLTVFCTTDKKQVSPLLNKGMECRVSFSKLSKEDLEKFSTSLREVIGYIKYSKDKKRLTEFLTDNPRMLMEANAARVIKAVTNTPLDIPEDVEVIDVCKAVEDMMNESKTEGAVAVLAGLVKDGL